MHFRQAFHRLMAPADDASSAGAAVDRGDELAAPAAPAAPANDPEPTLEDAGFEANKNNKADTSKNNKADAGDADASNADAGKDDKTDEPKSKKRIPLDRHEQLLNRERERRQELERQVAAFQNGRQVAATNADLTKLEDSLVEKERAYNAAIADGEVDKATVLMREIRTLDRQITATQQNQQSAIAIATAVEQVRYESALKRVEEAYPQLNKDSDEFDPDLEQDVVDLIETYRRRNMTPTEALQKAVKKLVPAESAAQTKATTVAPRVSTEDAQARVRADRATAAREKAAEADRRSPPSTAKVGLDSDKAGGGTLRTEDVMKMSQKDFARLDDADLARLRGDDF